MIEAVRAVYPAILQWEDASDDGYAVPAAGKARSVLVLSTGDKVPTHHASAHVRELVRQHRLGLLSLAGMIEERSSCDAE